MTNVQAEMSNGQTPSPEPQAKVLIFNRQDAKTIPNPNSPSVIEHLGLVIGHLT